MSDLDLINVHICASQDQKNYAYLILNVLKLPNIFFWQNTNNSKTQTIQNIFGV